MQSLWESELLNGSGSWSLGLELLFVFKTFPIASANVVALASHEMEAGVSLSVRWWCVDMMAGVGG